MLLHTWAPYEIISTGTYLPCFRRRRAFCEKAEPEPHDFIECLLHEILLLETLAAASSKVAAMAVLTSPLVNKLPFQQGSFGLV